MNESTVGLRYLRLVMASALLVYAASAAAQENMAPLPRGPLRTQALQFALTAGGGWSDNIGRTATNEESGTLGQAGLILDYEQRSRRLRSDVDANVVYERYFDDTFDNDVLGGADARFTFGIVPERFEWFLRDNYGQITTDPFSGSTPDNREDINYLTTGPDFMLRLGRAVALQLSARYSNTQYETSNLDAEGYGASVAIARELSGASSLSLNVTGDRVEFDPAALADDYDRFETFARYSVQGARTGIAVDVGYTSLDLGVRTSDGLLGRVSLTREMSASSILGFGIGTQFSNASDAFRGMQGQQGVRRDSQSVVATSDPFESRYVFADWNFSRNRTGFGLTVQYSEEKYENRPAFDRSLTTWEAYASRQLSRTTELRVYGSLQREDFDTGFEDEELQAGAFLAWQVGRRVELRLQYDRVDRTSIASATQYTENRGSLFVTWSPIVRQ